MQIALSPMRGLPGQPETTLSITGDTITVDGVAFDLSPVPEGGEAWPEGEHPFVGPITREGGEIRCSVIAHLDDSAAPDQPTDPVHWLVAVDDGPVTIPALRIDQEDAQ